MLQAEALEWGAPGYEDVVRTLASRKPELVLAGGGRAVGSTQQGG